MTKLKMLYCYNCNAYPLHKIEGNNAYCLECENWTIIDFIPNGA